MDSVYRIDVSATALIGEAAVSHDGPVLGIAYSGDGTQYTSDSTDGTIGLWDADGQLLGAVQPGAPNDLARSKWSTDGRTLLVTYADMSVFAFDIRPESWVDYACRDCGPPSHRTGVVRGHAGSGLRPRRARDHQRRRLPRPHPNPGLDQGFRGADDGIRTRDPHLGKVMLYQLSHVRVGAKG